MCPALHFCCYTFVALHVGSYTFVILNFSPYTSVPPYTFGPGNCEKSAEFAKLAAGNGDDAEIDINKHRVLHLHKGNSLARLPGAHG